MNPTAENLKGRCMDRQLARAKSSLNGLIHAFINESKKQQQKQEIAAPISTKKNRSMHGLSRPWGCSIACCGCSSSPSSPLVFASSAAASTDTAFHPCCVNALALLPCAFHPRSRIPRQLQKMMMLILPRKSCKEKKRLIKV
jgi:hypothetical protein